MSKRQGSIVVGCGRFGSLVADYLSDKDEEVTVIDFRAQSFHKLSPSFGGLSDEGDGRDIETLKRYEADKVKTLVACCSDDDDNIMISQIAKVFFEIPQVFARIQDTSKLPAIADTGIVPICPTTLAVSEFQRVCEDINIVEKAKKEMEAI
jgi:K+ transport systems, NAD-binding component